MRKLLILALLFMSNIGWAGTCGNGYLFTRQIILQKATGTDQTNFPYPIYGSYVRFRTAANGGEVQNTAANSIGTVGPADLVFCDAASGGNPLKYEAAFYEGTTGSFEFWVQIPTLHAASNDSIYVFANNTSVSTSQQDLSLWTDANYVWVMHYPDGTTLNKTDSTSVTGAVTTTGSPAAGIGIIDGAVAVSSARVNYASNTGMNTLTAWTFEAWIKPTTLPAVTFVTDKGSGLSGTQFILGTQTTTVWAEYFNGTDHLALAGGLSSGSWQYIAGTWNGTSMVAYNSAVAGTPLSYSVSPMVANTNALTVGGRDNGNNFTGSIDEVRGATVAKSANWLSTTYRVTSGNISPFRIVETPSVTTAVQWVSCASSSCVLGSVSTGNYLVVAATTNGTGTNCPSAPTDTLGLTFTLQTQVNVGTTYDGCVWSAPITTSGADTISLSAANYWATVFEVHGITTTGIVTATTTSVMPTTMTVTSPTSNAFLVCGTIADAAGHLPGTVTPSSYALTNVVTAPPNAGDRFLGVAHGIVGSGSQSCSLDQGQFGFMAVFGAATVVNKPRAAQVY